MTDIPVVLCFDDRILPGAGVTILSLIDAARPRTCYEVIILHPGLAEDVQAALRSLVAGTRHSMRFIHVPPSRLDGVPKGSGSWTEIVYYRLLASEVIPDRSRVVYSDVDVFVTDDVTEAFSTDLTGLEWAGVPLERNGPDMVMHTHFPENTKPQIVTSSFMVMDLDLMRRQGAVARYLDTIEAVGPRLRFFDLDLVNIASDEIGYLPLRYCVFEDIYEMPALTDAADWAYLQTVYSADQVEAARNDPAIIHYAGRRGKPWQRRHVPPYYRAVLDRLPRRLRRQTFRSWRRTWLTRKGHRRLPSRFQ